MLQLLLSVWVSLALIGDPWLDGLLAIVAGMPDDFPPFSTPGLRAPDLTPDSWEGIRAATPLIQDDFTEDDDRWTSHDTDVMTCAYLNGAYAMDVPLSLWGTSTIDADVDNFLYEVDARRVDGSEYSFAAGIVFRYLDADNYYRVEARSNGAYALTKVVDGVSAMVIESTESPLIRAGEEFDNRLGVLAVGSSLTVVINGAALQTVEDGSLDHGAIGLYVRAPERTCYGLDCVNPTGVTIAFDNLNVWPYEGAVPQPELIPTPTPTPTPAAVTLASLNIDWSPLTEEFDIVNPRLEEILEPTMSAPAIFVVFDFEAARDVGSVGYVALFINDQGKVKTASSVEFRPDPMLPPSFYDAIGGWNAGVRGTARFQLPDDVSKYVTIRLKRTQ